MWRCERSESRTHFRRETSAFCEHWILRVLRNLNSARKRGDRGELTRLYIYGITTPNATCVEANLFIPKSKRHLLNAAVSATAFPRVRDVVGHGAV